jgi:hypothetical protein
MASQVVYPVKVYNIILPLVVNSDQIGVHFIPIAIIFMSWNGLASHIMLGVLSSFALTGSPYALPNITAKA